VLLVLGHHWHQYGSAQFQPLPAFTRAGWIGVDLFFVLSGFLVGGLLVREYQASGRINARRFLARRGLRIYPAFYLLLVVSCALNSLGIVPFSAPTPSRVLAEIFFVQNYHYGIWNHTWSLAIEEHFYLLLLVAMLLVVRSQDQRQALRRIAFGTALLSLLLPVLRAFSLRNEPYSWFGHYTPTHLRLDALAFGVLLAALYHLEGERLQTWLTPRRTLIALGAALLVLPAFILEQSNSLMFTAGLTGLYVGFGAALMLAITTTRIKYSGPEKQLASIGEHSYAIYLWHMPVLLWLPGLVRRVAPALAQPEVMLFGYVAGSIVLGIFLTRLVETPILKLRDRLF